MASAYIRLGQQLELGEGYLQMTWRALKFHNRPTHYRNYQFHVSISMTASISDIFCLRRLFVTMLRRPNVFTMSRCSGVRPVPTWTRPQGGRVHYAHAAAEASKMTSGDLSFSS